MIAWDPTSEPASRVLPTRHEIEPIVAWKNAFLSAEYRLEPYAPYDWTKPFLSIASNTRYEVDAKAICLGMSFEVRAINLHDHGPAPNQKCGCGFYSWKDRRTALSYNCYRPEYVMLKVELYGRVFAHKEGYRAERQRVVEVRMKRLMFDDTLEERLGVPVLRLSVGPRARARYGSSAVEGGPVPGSFALARGPTSRRVRNAGSAREEHHPPSDPSLYIQTGFDVLVKDYLRRLPIL